MGASNLPREGAGKCQAKCQDPGQVENWARRENKEESLHLSWENVRLTEVQRLQPILGQSRGLRSASLADTATYQGPRESLWEGRRSPPPPPVVVVVIMPIMITIMTKMITLANRNQAALDFPGIVLKHFTCII